MSSELVISVFARYPGSGADLNFFQALAERANPQGNCAVTLAELAAAARISLPSAGLSMRRLRRERWIVTSQVPGYGRCLTYQINLPKLARSIRPDCDPDVPQNDAVVAARKAAERRAKKYAAVKR